MVAQKNKHDKITKWLKAMNYFRKKQNKKSKKCEHVTVEFMMERGRGESAMFKVMGGDEGHQPCSR